MEITEAQLNEFRRIYFNHEGGSEESLLAAFRDVLGITVTRPDPLLAKAREIAAASIRKIGWSEHYARSVEDAKDDNCPAVQSALAALRHADAVVREVRGRSGLPLLRAFEDILAKLGAAS